MAFDKSIIFLIVTVLASALWMPSRCGSMLLQRRVFTAIRRIRTDDLEDSVHDAISSLVTQLIEDNPYLNHYLEEKILD